MKNVFHKPLLIIRKKPEGENSIEEFANRIKRYLDVDIVTCPCASVTIKGLWENIRFARTLRAPVYHIVSPGEAYLLPFLSGGKRIITYHDLGTRYASRNALYRFVRIATGITPSKYFADYITFVSGQTCREYTEHVGTCRSGGMKIIYNSYDDRLVPAEKTGRNKFTVLQIGTADRKNIMGTIEAVRGLDVKLNIIGKLKEKHIQKLEAYHIDYSNRTDIPYEDVVKAYRDCDVVCFPTFYEGYGLPVLEANVMKRPVIAGDIGIIREIGGRAVFYADPYDIKSIRNAIVTLEKDRDLRQRLVEEGVRNAGRFAPEKIYGQYQKIYSRVFILRTASSRNDSEKKKEVISG